MFILNYTESFYQSKINVLEEILRRLDGHLSTMKTLREKVYDFWNDEMAREAVHDLDLMIDRVESAQERTKDLLQCYRSSVEELSRANVLNLSILKDAGELLGNLKGKS